MKSFFEKLTGSVDIEDTIDIEDEAPVEKGKRLSVKNSEGSTKDNEMEWMEEEAEEGELTIDMFQNPDEIIVKTIVAGVKPEDLDISITRDMVTVRGKREEANIVSEENYFARELYWGSFSRTISLPAEIDIEGAEATEKHGLLILKLPKIDKGKKAKLKVKPR